MDSDSYSFSRYVNKHAEEMREIFVSHQGKKELVVTDVGTIKSVNWDILIARLSGLIEQNTTTDVKEWMEPNFSTTTTLSRTVGSLCLMSSMQQYFSYKCCLYCGLPSVTLHGTLQDWEAVRTKAERLKQFINLNSVIGVLFYYLFLTNSFVLILVMLILIFGIEFALGLVVVVDLPFLKVGSSVLYLSLSMVTIFSLRTNQFLKQIVMVKWIRIIFPPLS